VLDSVSIKTKMYINAASKARKLHRSFFYQCLSSYNLSSALPVLLYFSLCSEARFIVSQGFHSHPAHQNSRLLATYCRSLLPTNTRYINVGVKYMTVISWHRQFRISTDLGSGQFRAKVSYTSMPQAPPLSSSTVPKQLLTCWTRGPGSTPVGAFLSIIK
jgi:hypothetical protein